MRGFFVLVTDITRLKKTERALIEAEHQLQASERLTSLATLAAGIAHEINNPLAAVLAHTELALESLPPDAPDLASVRADLVAARDNTLRVRDIVQSMKLLARGDTTARESVDVNDTLQRSIDFTAASLRYRARILRELQPGLRIEGNASQLAQVFVNLLTNAAQSLPEASQQTNEIHVTTRREGDLVVIEVSDNGCGIPEESRERIFDPFYTTKSAGQGMGLGLSISSAIVKAFGGTLSVESTVGRGSAFRVALPVAPEITQSQPPPVPPSGQSRRLDTGIPTARPRVLIIDDELAVAKTLERVLSKDCEVVVRNHSRDAIPLLVDGHERPFDMILCDLMMPEPGGEEVYSQVTANRPELAERFVFMTGGAFTPQGRRFLASVPVEVLEKPFDLARLRELVAARVRKS